jgi:hypothetical protein
LSRCMLVVGMAGAMAWGPTLIAQEKDRDMRDQGSVQEAIRFEKAKQAAAERQERIDAGEARADRQRVSTPKRADTAARKPAAERTVRKDDAAH